MSQKRRDNRNRVLRSGESQRKDGRYVYKYKAPDGTTKYIYSWKLEKNDRVPAGKADEPSLREREEQIQRDLVDQINTTDGNMTVLELITKYLSLKVNVRKNTQVNYKFVLNIIKKEAFGQLPICKIKQSDAKAWLIKLQKADGRGFSSIQAIRGVVRPAFEMAVEDDCIRKNPFQFPLTSVVVNDSVTREALSKEEEEAFLTFIKNDPWYNKYYDGMYILFHTGLRISEFCGLTISDIDLRNKRIRVDHQLHRAHDMEYIIEDTKTKSGERFVPMSPMMAECFKRIIRNRKTYYKEPTIAGYTKFLFLDKNGMPMVALHWEKYFQHSVETYNKTHTVQLPKITPHVCRHTFCSNMAKNGMNPKTLQYIMGHSEISVTLDTYTHLNIQDAQCEFDRVMGA